MADDDARPEVPTEVVRLEVEMDLVPDWSKALEALGHHYGEAMELDVESNQLIVRIEVRTDRKEQLLGHMKHAWDQFVAQRKQQGRWNA